MTGPGDRTESVALWQRWRLEASVAAKPAAPDPLVLAAYADGRLDEIEAEPVEELPTVKTRKAKAATAAPVERAANRPLTDADPMPSTATAHRAKDPGEHAAQPVTGYLVRWEFPAVDYLKGTADRTEGTPAWLVRCNAHGDTAAAVNVEGCKKVGTKAARATWCKGCKKDAAAKAKAAK